MDEISDFYVAFETADWGGHETFLTLEDAEAFYWEMENDPECLWAEIVEVKITIQKSFERI